MARELEYGQVHINSISVYSTPMAPQGGVKGRKRTSLRFEILTNTYKALDGVAKAPLGVSTSFIKRSLSATMADLAIILHCASDHQGFQ